jgi:hypothetical protein
VVKQPLLSSFVHRRSMGDMRVADFPSLLLIPMLERIAQRQSSAILKTVKPRDIFRFNLHPQ